MKRYGYAAFILTLGDNQRYMTHLHPGALAGFIPGGAGYTAVFSDKKEDTVSWMTEGNIVKQSRFHCPWLKPENIRPVYSMISCQGKAAVSEMCKKNAEEIVRVIEVVRSSDAVFE